MFESTVWSLGVFGLALVVCTIVAVVPRSESAAERAALTLGRRVGLGLTPATRAGVLRRLTRRRRVAATASAIGIVLVIAAIAASTGGVWGAQSSWLTIGAVYSGGALGNAVAASLRQDAVEGDVRIARGTSVTLDDYVPAPERVAARVCAASGLAVLGIVASLRGLTALEAVAAGCIVLAVLVFEVGGRRIVEHPQPAGGVDALAWEDALRSLDLRAMAVAPVMSGLYAAIAAAMQVSAMVGALLAVAGAVTALVITVGGTLSGRQRYYLTRLWPDAEGAAA